MPKFRYIGDCAAKMVKPFGIEFPVGDDVEVKDKAIAGKLRANSHFEEAKSGKKSKAEVSDNKGDDDGDESGDQEQSGPEAGDQSSGSAS